MITKFRTLLTLGLISVPIIIVDQILTFNPTLIIAALLYNIVFQTYLGNTIAIHRYLSHRAFSTGAVRHKLLCALSVIPAHGPPVNYAIVHRHHHRYSDQAQDTHTPREGFWHSWLLYPFYHEDYYIKEKRCREMPRDLMRDPTVMWFQTYYYHIWFTVIAITMLIDWRITVYFLLWPIALGLWDNFWLSWVSHKKNIPGNYRNYDRVDDTYNNKWAGFLHGELHHNHHEQPGNYDMAHKDHERDLAAVIIRQFFLVDKERAYKL